MAEKKTVYYNREIKDVYCRSVILITPAVNNDPQLLRMNSGMCFLITLHWTECWGQNMEKWLRKRETETQRWVHGYMYPLYATGCRSTSDYQVWFQMIVYISCFMGILPVWKAAH